jgi:MraZ protein
MRLFTGVHERSIDQKNRIQLPVQYRNVLGPESDGRGIYVTLGEDRHTLLIFSESGFDELATRMETEFNPGPEARRFELQFFSLASFVELDGQGRFVLPDRLRKKARLGDEVYLVGRKYRIEIWNKAEYERSLGIDWESDDWPEWQGYLRMRPAERAGPG